MRVTYSTGARFAGRGTGQVSYHTVLAFHQRQVLERLICGSYRETGLPTRNIKSLGLLSRGVRKLAAYDRSNRVDYLYRILYDRWASRQLTGCDIFWGWSGYCLETIRRAKARGVTIILHRAIAHPTYLDRLLQSEMQNWGTKHYGSPAANFVRQEIELADFVVTPSEFVNDTFRAEGAAAENLVLIPLGVDTRRFMPSKKGRTSPFRALFVGQVSLRKGAHTLLQAWKDLGWADAELWIAGQMKLPPELSNQYQGMTGVSYLGNFSDLAPLYQAADVFVLPSLAEGSALVTYEAMACGLPMIVTRNTGSVARHEAECLTIPVGDSDAIARSLERLRADDALRRNMGAAARTRVESFSWEAYRERVVEAILEIAR